MAGKSKGFDLNGRNPTIHEFWGNAPGLTKPASTVKPGVCRPSETRRQTAGSYPDPGSLNIVPILTIPRLRSVSRLIHLLPPKQFGLQRLCLQFSGFLLQLLLTGGQLYGSATWLARRPKDISWDSGLQVSGLRHLLLREPSMVCRPFVPLL